MVAACAAFLAVTALGVVADPVVVSVSDQESPGGSPARGAAVSADGRYVAFTSSAPLAGVSTGGVLQLYVRDRLSGRTLLASATAGGQPASAPIDDPADHRAYAISGDGRFAVFASVASNLAPEEADGAALDVFRKDLVTGAVTVVSRGVDGAAANGPAGGDPDTSYDGSRVAYETGSATNLWAGDASTDSDVVVRDLRAGTVERVSVTGAGAPLTGVLRRAAISADGRAVAFEDDASVAVRDLGGGTTITVIGAARPDLSGDGSVLVYESAGGVSRRTLPSGAATQVLTSAASPAVSADGMRVVAETSVAHPPVTDGNGALDVYAWRLAGTVERVSQRIDASEVSAPSGRPAISGNGAVVAFDLDDGAAADSLAATDANAQPDVLAASLAATDAAGPALAVTAPPPGTATGAAVSVAGTASDPSGVVAVTVDGHLARRAGGGGFAVDVPLLVGPNAVTVRARDGAGNVTEQVIPVLRSADPGAVAPAKARARALTVRRAGRATVARFRLDPGATRVTVRLWRRVPRAGRAPSWTPAGPLRRVAATSGSRRVLVHNRPLAPNVYQVRVAVVSAGGVAVASARHVVSRAPR